MIAGPVRHALVLADGDRVEPAALDAAWPGWDDGVDQVIAADGGARHAAGLGRAIDLWVGDGDSIEPEELARLRAAGVPIEAAATDKDESDLELAALAAVARGAARITVLGAFGGPRLDHALANVALLAHPALAGRDVRLLDGTTRARLVGPGEHRLDGRPGDLVSLIPQGGDVAGIRTSGLRYPLDDEPLVIGPARGLSNVRLSADAGLVVRDGRLLIVETPATFSA